MIYEDNNSQIGHIFNHYMDFMYIHVNLFLPQEEYVAEGLQWSFVKYQDNQGCLDLIEGSPVGVFALLNEVLSQLFVLLFLIIKKMAKSITY